MRSITGRRHRTQSILKLAFHLFSPISNRVVMLLAFILLQHPEIIRRKVILLCSFERFPDMNQLSRRNLTDFQKNKIALKYEEVIAKQMKKRQGERNDLKEHSDQLVKKLNPTTTCKELANTAGTSEGSIQRTKLILDNSRVHVLLTS